MHQSKATYLKKQFRLCGSDPQQFGKFWNSEKPRLLEKPFLENKPSTSVITRDHIVNIFNQNFMDTQKVHWLSHDLQLDQPWF